MSDSDKLALSSEVSDRQDDGVRALGFVAGDSVVLSTDAWIAGRWPSDAPRNRNCHRLNLIGAVHHIRRDGDVAVRWPTYRVLESYRLSELRLSRDEHARYSECRETSVRDRTEHTR
jgi:hypothetical protein